VVSIYEAAQRYQARGVPTVVLAGVDYGMGSSRDWAAKGTFLLGVRAVLAESFERIHRSNLVGMGVLPLEYRPGETPPASASTATRPSTWRRRHAAPKQVVQVAARKPDGGLIRFEAVVRIDTPVEIDYYRNGGILHTVLRSLHAAATAAS
jgi:aconitate hydratase